MITILQKQVFCLSRRVKVSMSSNQMSQYHIQMWYHVTCYTRDFAPVKFERLGIWPRYFHQRSSIEIPVGGQHNITQQISRKWLVDEKFVKWHLMVERPKFWLVHRQFLSSEEAWMPIKDSVGFPWGGAAAKYLLSFANLQDNILIFRNWVAKHWPAPKHPVRHIDLWSLAPRLEIWTPGLHSLSSSWRASC